MSSANRLRSLVLAAFTLGCTQWGTSALRSVDVWWACPDRNAGCSSENAALTLVQMDNVVSGARRDLDRAQDSGRFKTVELDALVDSLLVAYQARGMVSSPPAWDSALADYVQAAIDSERLASKTWERR